MKHKQFEQWILEERQLNSDQQNELSKHLDNCSSCRLLHKGWSASKKLISQSAIHAPAPGFISRWKNTVEQKQQFENIRNYRLTLFGLILLALLVSVGYVWMTGSAAPLFANSITLFSDLIIGISHGLSTIGYWINRMPIAVPITAGFLFFGLVNAFALACIFLIWNLSNRRLQTNEI